MVKHLNYVFYRFTKAYFGRHSILSFLLRYFIYPGAAHDCNTLFPLAFTLLSSRYIKLLKILRSWLFLSKPDLTGEPPTLSPTELSCNRLR